MSTRALTGRHAAGPLLLLTMLAGALLLRLGLAGVAKARDPLAGAMFGLALLIGCAAAGWRPGRPGWRELAGGAGGALLLVALPILSHLRHAGAPLGAGFTAWAPVVVLVALAEEALLRGVLWDALLTRRGPNAALAITTVAFALLHLPLYGPGVLPLDLAVGIILGGLRQATDGWWAPGLAHTAADLAGWWLR